MSEFFEPIFANWDYLLIGMGNTLLLAIVSIFLGGLLAIPLALARAYRHPWLNKPISFYTYFFRGTPLLVQTWLIYYGLPQFEVIRETFLWFFFSSPYFCALLAFTLNTAAYQAEIMRGTIENTPSGEIDAARASGMSAYQQVARIILPSSYRRAIPALSNEVIFMLHGSVIASTITVIDILGAGRYINARYYLAYEGFIAAAVLYMCLVFIIAKLFRMAEKKYLRHMAPRSE